MPNPMTPEPMQGYYEDVGRAAVVCAVCDDVNWTARDGDACVKCETRLNTLSETPSNG